MIYLASPYSHPDPGVRTTRYRQAAWHAVRLMQDGRLVYSPIVHSHPLSVLGLPGDWPFWADHNRAMLAACQTLVVLTLPGWEHSKGIAAELALAAELEIPVEYEDPREVSGG